MSAPGFDRASGERRMWHERNDLAICDSLPSLQLKSLAFKVMTFTGKKSWDSEIMGLHMPQLIQK